MRTFEVLLSVVAVVGIALCSPIKIHAALVPVRRVSARTLVGAFSTDSILRRNKAVSNQHVVSVMDLKSAMHVLDVRHSLVRCRQGPGGKWGTYDFSEIGRVTWCDIWFRAAFRTFLSYMV